MSAHDDNAQSLLNNMIQQGEPNTKHMTRDQITVLCADNDRMQTERIDLIVRNSVYQRYIEQRGEIK
jgi:hypothetical protein